MIYFILGLVTIFVPFCSIWGWENWKKWNHNKKTENLEDLTLKYSLSPEGDGGFTISNVTSEMPLADRLFIIKMAKVQLFITQRDGANKMSPNSLKKLATTQELLAIYEIELEDMLNGANEGNDFVAFEDNVLQGIEQTTTLEPGREKL